jgi:choice-of-anchor A domain-containing protein
MLFSIVLIALSVHAYADVCTAPSVLEYQGDSVNVLTFGDYHCTSDVEGRLFVGGDLDVSSYSVGDKLDDNLDLDLASSDYLVVDGKASFSNGRVYYGNMVVNPNVQHSIGSSVIYGLNEGNKNRLVENADRFDFEGAKLYYSDLSKKLGAMTATGQTRYRTWEYRFTGRTAGSPEFEVFDADCAKMKKGTGSSRQMEISESVQVVIFNVRGSSCGFVSGGFFFKYFNSGTQTRTIAPKVIYNFPCAQRLDLGSVGVEGSILAPHAHLTGPAGVIWGQIVVDSYSTAIQQNHLPFSGCISDDILPDSAPWECSFDEPAAEDPCGDKDCGDTCIVNGDMAGMCNSAGDCSFDYGNLGCDQEVLDHGNDVEDAVCTAGGWSFGVDEDDVYWCLASNQHCVVSTMASRGDAISPNTVIKRSQLPSSLSLDASERTVTTSDGYTFSVSDDGVQITKGAGVKLNQWCCKCE